MSRFESTIESTAVVSADRAAVWDALTDPDLLAKLTPLLRGIDAHGELWTWHLTRIAALGVAITPSFTEKMTFTDRSRIEYAHQPRGRERAGAQGWYELSDVDGGTCLRIKLTLSVELPLPRAAARPVQRVMLSTMRRTGDRFSANLLRHLGATELSSTR